MKITLHPHASRRGVALIIVMVVIFVLALLAGGFAYSMRVEMKLARNSNSEVELEWLARSGIELARYYLAEQLRFVNEPYDALNQKWAGGPGINLPEDSPLHQFNLEDNELGRGRFSVRITDLERRFNINTAAQGLVQQALMVVGVEGTAVQTILDSLLDWMDPDEDPHLSGAESDYYLGMDPPYYAKNGLIDDMSELLLIQGITPEIYWGTDVTAIEQPVRRDGFGESRPTGVGLVDLFSTLSMGRININTATVDVLQVIPGIDESIAAGIVSLRAGLDGVDGTEDDVPFAGAGELINVPGMFPEMVQAISQICVTRSFTFLVEVDVEVDNYKRRYIAVLRRTNPQNIPLVRGHWE